MGIATRCAPSVDEKAEKVALPVVYAFLSDKTQESYQAVLRAVKDAVREQGIPAQNPETIVTDFEHSIKKTAISVYPSANVHYCFFSILANHYTSGY